MITKDISVKVKKDEVKLNTMLYAYEGDRGLVFELTLGNWKYFFSQAIGVEEDQLVDCSARILILGPDGEKMKLVDVPIEENEIKFKVNQNLTQKVGDYKVYIQIFKEDGATVTCPPFVFTVKPLGDYTDILPSDVGLIKVQDENLLAYNTISDYGIRTVSELPKITEISDSDYVILQQDGITNIITTADLFKKYKEEISSYVDEKDGEVKEYIDSEIQNVNSDVSEKVNSVKQYSDEKDNEVKAYADSLIEKLIGSAPETLDTIYEIAAALQENEGVVDNLISQIAQKADKAHTHNATDIIEDETHKFVTDTEKTNWYDKYTKSEVEAKLEPKFDGVEVVEGKLQLKSGDVIKGEVQLPKGFTGSYNDLTDKPETFNPSEHTHTKDEITDLFQVINSLESDSETDPLSAKQGKVLKERLDNMETTGTHSHTNKAELDKIVEGKVEEWDNKETVEGSQQKADESLSLAKTYADNLIGLIKGSANEEYSTLEKIENIIKENKTTVDSEISNIEGNYEALKGRVDLFEQSNHSHENKATLDKITEEVFNSWNNKETVEGSQDKADKAYQDSKQYVDQIFGSINFNLTKRFTVSEWSTDDSTGLYKADVVHNLNNENLIINSYDTLSKSNELISYTIKDANTITVLAKTNESIDVVIMAGNISTDTYSTETNIDDNSINKISTWSSDKINTELTNKLQDAKSYTDTKIKEVQNNRSGKFNVSSWELDGDTQLYKSTINHNLNTEYIIVQSFSKTNKLNKLISYKIIDTNNIEVMSEEQEEIEVMIIGIM